MAELYQLADTGWFKLIQADSGGGADSGWFSLIQADSETRADSKLIQADSELIQFGFENNVQRYFTKMILSF